MNDCGQLPSDNWMTGGGEMGARIRAYDWSQTPLGPIENWCQPLRTSVSISLECAFPIILWWGPELTVLYNDEYRAALGAKHPAALGQSGMKVWASIWDTIGPMLAQVVERAQPTRSRDLLLHIDRYGYPEEAYFSFSYSPIHDERGQVSGVFCPVIETTEKVIGERRLRTLRDLAARCSGIASEASVYRSAAAVLGGNPHDVPFALFYRVDGVRPLAELHATAGFAASAIAAPHSLPLDKDDVTTANWSLGAVARSGKPVVLDDLRHRFAELPTGAWKEPAQSAVALPVLLPGQDRPRAILVLAASPMRALDDDYLTFFGLIATQVAAGLADAQARTEERHRAEALAEIDRAKTTFFSNVSHEFRTPLTLMLGPLEDALADASLSPHAHEQLEVAHRNSLRLLKLVNTLLDFSRIEAGRAHASYEPVDLSLFTTELASVFRSTLERAGLRLVVDCAPLGEPVFVDRDMWEQIVLNLLSNAFKFTFAGEISLGLAVSGDFVELTVRDTGIGIPAAELPHVFERFHRVKGARGRSYEGTGIGLALVQELAKLHGGTIRVESKVDGGSTFVVSVRRGPAHLSPDRIVAPRTSSDLAAVAGRQDARRPSDTYIHEALRWLPSELTRSLADSSTTARSPVKGGTRPTARPRARILLADDNADMREYVQRLLIGEGYEVDPTVDGQQALETALARRPDLAVIDVMMPRLDGSALLKALRADERTATVPIVMLSARAGEEARIEGLNAGADDYLIKPFSARELLARVGAHLEMARIRADAEQRIRTSEQRLRNIIEQLPAGVGVMNTAGVWELTNALMAEYVPDAVPSMLVGRPAQWPAWDAQRQAIPADVWPSARALRGERVVPGVEMLCRTDGGAESWLRVSASPLRLDERIVGATVVVRDITRAKRAEEAMLESQEQLRDADRRKDEFLAMLAHELRNPLAPIRTGLEVIRRARDTPPSVERVRVTMERQVGHMVRLIDDLLDVSRITSGKIQLQRKRTLLADLVNNAVDANRAALDVAQVRLILQLPDEACILNVDPTRAMQVLSNLLHNASKFTSPGGTVTVTASCRSPQGADLPGEVVITVSDTGIGISPDMLPRVFELFTQAAQHNEGRQPGLGIGLALARRLVEMHGGTIDVASDGLGHGSSFTIRLPLARETESVTSLDDAISAPLVARRVVVIDDNEDAARMMAMLIEVLGSEARVANNGAAGILAVGEFHPDVVLLDIGMPEIDGYETCRRLRKEAAGASAFIVAVTGWGQEQDKRRAVDAGFDAHLTKPADPAILEQILTAARPRVATLSNRTPSD